MSAVVRPARRDDLDAVAALDLLCFGAAAWSPGLWAEEFARLDHDRLVHVAEDGSAGNDAPRLLGYVVLQVPPMAEDPVDLTRIAVAPAHRRTGVGRRLMDAALDAVAGRSIMLEVADSNDAARRLYQDEKFVEISRRRGYYAGGEDAVVLRRGPVGQAAHAAAAAVWPQGVEESEGHE